MSGQVAGQIGTNPRPPLAKNLRDEMSRTGVKAEQLAVALDVPERLVRKWRSERDVNPSWENVQKLAEHFGRTPDWFYADHSQEPTTGEAA